MDNELEQDLIKTERTMRNPNKEFGSGPVAVLTSTTNKDSGVDDDADSNVSISNVSADEFDRKAFGKKLRHLRGQLSRREVAIGASVSAPALLLWEKGSSEPTASKIANLCKFYGISSDELLGLPVKPKKEEKPEQPSEPVNPPVPEPEQPSQPSEPESPSEPEQPSQPPIPMCKDCPLVATVQSLSTAVTLALSRK